MSEDLNIKVIESILFVENESLIKNELSKILEKYAQRVYLASDGEDGLNQFNLYKPEIVISDINMPKMNGIDMSKEIKKINRKTPIIFLTALNDVEYFQQAIELQVDGYILKPIDLDLLINKLMSIKEYLSFKKELKRKEALLIQQSKMASMGEMVSNITYQWIEPLSVISAHITNLQILMENNDSIPKSNIEICTNDVYKQINSLSENIHDFRDFLKPSEKSFSKEFDLKKFIEKCLLLIKGSFDNELITIIKDIDEKINSSVSQNYLLQAILNILNNAKDALSEVSMTQKKLVFIVTAKEDSAHNLIIVIKDNAGGIDENIIDDIFEPYFSTKPKTLGTGLGLYMTKEIVTKNFNGNIHVENEYFEHQGIEYKGAKFTIKIPLNK